MKRTIKWVLVVKLLATAALITNGCRSAEVAGPCHYNYTAQPGQPVNVTLCAGGVDTIVVTYTP